MRYLWRAGVVVVLLTGGALVAQGPLTNALNLRVKTDANGYLLASAVGYTGPDGPLTNFGNIQLRTDANGYLLTAFGPGASATIPFGTGTGTYTPSGVLHSQFTPVSNTTIGGDDVLFTYTLPANSLSTNGMGVRITASGVFTGNTNAKSARLYFGATQLLTTASAVGSPNGTAFRMVIEVVRTGAATQVAAGSLLVVGTGWTALTTPAETLSGPVVLQLRGLGLVAAGDITGHTLLVEAF